MDAESGAGGGLFSGSGPCLPQGVGRFALTKAACHRAIDLDPHGGILIRGMADDDIFIPVAWLWPLQRACGEIPLLPDCGQGTEGLENCEGGDIIKNNRKKYLHIAVGRYETKPDFSRNSC